MTVLDKKAEDLGIDLSTSISGIRFSNPIMTASGTFSPSASGAFYDINELGAAVTKGVSADMWNGNDTPRIAEAFGGIINSVGLQNPGMEDFAKGDLKQLEVYNTRIIVNVAGHSIEDYVRVIEYLKAYDSISMFEINISCPNVSEGGMAFGTDVYMAAEVARSVRAATKKPLIMKLTPNVTDITKIARAVEAEGINAISLINTVRAMSIDVKLRRAVLANKIGGLSGPAVKAIALGMVYETVRAVRIPVIGIGGISKGTDVVEFLAAGASAVGIGTAALSDPKAIPRIKRELIEYMRDNDFDTISELRHAFDL